MLAVRGLSIDELPRPAPISNHFYRTFLILSTKEENDYFYLQENHSFNAMQDEFKDWKC